MKKSVVGIVVLILMVFVTIGAIVWAVNASSKAERDRQALEVSAEALGVLTARTDTVITFIVNLRRINSELGQERDQLMSLVQQLTGQGEGVFPFVSEEVLLSCRATTLRRWTDSVLICPEVRILKGDPNAAQALRGR